MNDKPFEYCSHFGTTFKSERCDFRSHIHVTPFDKLTPELMMREVAEMIGHHAMNIRPQLTGGFQGYDCIYFNIEKSWMETRKDS